MVVILSVFSSFSWKSYSPEKHDPPYNFYYNIANRTITKTGTENIELIIAHKSLAECITFYTGTDAMPWIPEYNIHPDKLWRIVADINETELHYYAGKKVCLKLAPHYFLLKEIDWQQILTKIQREDFELFELLNNWKNPSEKRPKYLLKNK